MNQVLLFAVLIGALPVTSVFAQSQPAAVRAAAVLEEGTVIRIRQRDGILITGRFQSASGNEIVLDTGSIVRVPADNVDSLWRGGRAAGRGAKTGAIAGGLSGAVALAALAAILVEGLCETDDCNPGGAAVVGGLIGGAGGAGFGALLGAIIGSGVPTWKALYGAAAGGIPAAGAPPRDTRRVSAVSAPKSHDHIGTLRVAMSFARGTDRPNHSAAIGGRISFLPRFGRNFWGGLEAAAQGIGGWRARQLGVRYDLDREPSLFVYTEDASIRVLQFAGVARFGKAEGRIRPYAVASAGVNLARMETRSIVDCPSCPTSGVFPRSPGLSGGWSSHPGVALGAGVDAFPHATNLSVGFEARIHSFPRFVTVGVSAGTSW